MSHGKLRKENDCLNCGAEVQGPYCHNCGQENIVPHETFWNMVKHFFYDITHFDSKFFDTLKDLLFRPGYLPKEFVSGRRASYLNPIKMYVFTSAVFFLIFFSFFNNSANKKNDLDELLTKDDILKEIESVEKNIRNDSTNVKWVKMLQVLKDTARALKKSDLIANQEDFNLIGMGLEGYKNINQYDSVQSSLPMDKRDNWIKKILIKKGIGINEKYRDDPMNGFTKLKDGFLHKLPYLLFISLPLFALFLKLVYIRRKEFYYFDHGIFSIHHYIFTFILLLLVFTFQMIADLLNSELLNFIAGFLFFSGGFYLYKGMRKFYGQRRTKTVIKFILLNVMGLISMLILFVFFVIFSVFEL